MKNFFTVVFIILSIISCDKKQTDVSRIVVDPGFSNYINAFTSGIVSSESPIKIVLIEPYSKAIAGEVVDNELFEFSPKIEGEAYWLDNQTIEFRPSKALTSGQSYHASFELHKLRAVPNKFKTLDFGFKVLEQHLNVFFDGMKAVNKDFSQQEIFGHVKTSDIVDPMMLQKTLIASQNGNELDIVWEHLEDKKNHNYVIKNVVRSDYSGSVLLSWDGDPIGSVVNDELKIEIPPLDEFRVVQISVNQASGLYYSIQFSDPLDSDQDLTGLITLKSQKELRYIINEQEVKVYPKGRPSQTEELHVHRSVVNANGVKLFKDYKEELYFSIEKPEIRLLGDGVIMPSSGDVSFPFKAINLKAVNIRVLKVYEHNVNQFFQSNQFDGSFGLARVGRLVYDNSIELISDESLDYGEWNNFSVNFNEIVEAEPGSIYRVMLSFEPNQSLYPCSDSTAIERNMRRMELNFDGENYFRPDSWYSEDFNYREKDDPCTTSYYQYHNRSVSANIFSSNFGMIAKETAGDTYNVTVTDLRSSDPLEGIKIEAFNFQNIRVGEGSTNASGVSQFNVTSKPYLLVASKGKQKGYLRVDAGSALSVSLYNVGGRKVDRGVKGFIYGERGVWRPGDSIYLSFMLEDKLNVLPESHPISMELFDPMGKSFEKMIKTQGEKGLYVFKFKTNSSDPTGKWQAVATVGGSKFGKYLKVETIKPNRIKIDYDFSDIIYSDQNINSNVQANWMYGSPASGLKVTSELIISPVKTTFNNYEGFSFDDRSIQFYRQEPIQIDSKTDSRGKTKLDFKWSRPKETPGMLKFSFNTKIFEKGGDFSQDFLSKKYSPFKSYTGLKMEAGGNWLMALDTEKKHKIAIASVDEKGKAMDQNVTIELYKMNWNWWWEGSGNNEITQYINRRSQDLIKTSKFKVTGGKSFFELSFPRPGWGKYLLRIIDEKSGHSSSQVFYGSYSDWYNDSSGGDNSAASALNLETDQETYNVGDKIQVTVPSGGVGNIYVTIEKGNKIIDQMWVKADNNSTIISLDATVAMTPNVYVSATLIQPHVQDKNSLPIRMYGIIPIYVYDENTILEPLIQAPKEVQPENNYRISVKEKNGHKMSYSLAVVDEGLLSLTRFKTPNAWDNFYAKEALNVRSWDLYRYVMGAQTGKMSPLLAIGGDEALNYKEDTKANRFKPVVSYLGPFFLEKDEEISHNIHMPNYIGAVRVMVVGGFNGAYGSAEKEIQVRQPLMVLSTLPRVLGPSETVKIPINIITMDDRIKEVKVKITGNEYLKPIHTNEQIVEIKEKGEKTIYFDYKVARKLGVAKFKVEVQSGKHRAFEELEILIRPPNPKITSSIDQMIEPEKKWTKEYKAKGIPGSNSASIQISRIPNLDLEKHLKYLIGYPHGCIEQTTSSVFPQLYLPELVSLSDDDKQKVKSNVMAGINRLKTFQVTSGGFSYWPGGNQASEWGSTYAGHFLLEAKNKGYNISEGLINGWLKFQKLTASNWQRSSYRGYGRYGGDLTQAYRLYTLALSGNSDLGAMNRLRNDALLSNAGAWRLAAAYALMGRKDVALELSKRSWDIKPYRSMSYSFGSDVRDLAMKLETMFYLDLKNDGYELLKDLTSRLNSGWHSTQTRAYGLLAIGKFVGSSMTSDELEAELVINGIKESIGIKSAVWSIDVKAKDLNQGTIEVMNNSGQNLFVSLTQTGIPLEMNKISKEKELIMKISYQDLTGVSLDVQRLEQGQDFKAIVQIKHPGIRSDYKEVALNQVFPSGWQIVNTRISDTDKNNSQSNYSYRDIRDDRVYTYFDLERGETKTFEVLLNATFVGRYYMPAVFCAPMYDESIQSLKPGKWVEVVRNDN
ncbi:alpha-2-macroglobulin family protein [Lutimonas sp.]|uniref:alpha-2-macroglobulin family protein n=1 Tax=Lutimonas sp. TaxID=1872403 RepID=UPI003D9B3429